MILIARPGPTIRGSLRVTQGGSRLSGDLYCRSAFRSWFEPMFRYSNLGFRVILRKRDMK